MTQCEHLKDLAPKFSRAWFLSRRHFNESGRWVLGVQGKVLPGKAPCSRTAGLILVDIENALKAGGQIAGKIGFLASGGTGTGENSGKIVKVVQELKGGIMAPALSDSPIKEVPKSHSSAANNAISGVQISEMQRSVSQAYSATTKPLGQLSELQEKKGLSGGGQGGHKGGQVKRNEGIMGGTSKPVQVVRKPEERILERLIAEALETLIAFDKKKFFLHPVRTWSHFFPFFPFP